MKDQTFAPTKFFENSSTLATSYPEIGKILLRKGLVSEKDVAGTATQVRGTKLSFFRELLSVTGLSSEQVAQTISQELNIPLLDLGAVDPSLLPTQTLKPEEISELQVIPLVVHSRKIIVGAVDPTNDSIVNQIRFKTKLAPEVVAIELDKFDQFCSLNGIVNDNETDLSGWSGVNQLEDVGIAVVENESTTQENDPALSSPVASFIQKVLTEAVKKKASDLHFEPFEKFYRVRFRIDGELQDMVQPPTNVKDMISSRLKVMARLDITERRVPQDGRMRLRMFNDKIIDFRINTLPTVWGEKIVLRILDASSAQKNINDLGYENEEKSRLMTAIKRPYGMVLVTGPTGSGKTVSLYACLNLINDPNVNITTVEDPVEINFPGINQININERAGLTFAIALRAILRQDPDVVMIGEMRDKETVEIGVKAAQTGHLVLSTLHTNDAPATITRMRDMGLPPFMLASSILLITAQRLVRRNCPTCSKPVKIPTSALIQAGFKEEELDGSWTPMKGIGCANCNKSGYRGRVGVYQALPISSEIQQLIMDGADELTIAKQASLEGVRTLRQSGLIKVRSGATTLEQVLAATND